MPNILFFNHRILIDFFMFFVLFNFLIFSKEEIHVKYHLENISSLTNVCYFYNDDFTKILSVNHGFYFF